MQEKAISFYSDGYELVGSLYFPDDFDSNQQYPLVIACSGYMGLNAIYPRLFATALAPAGYITLGFDYRGNGKSAGTPGRILLEEQMRDIRHSITFASQQPNVNTDEIILLGWGMGAGICIQVTAEDERVSAVAAFNGFYNGRAFLRARHSDASLDELHRRLEQDRIDRVMQGKSNFTDPFDVYPLDSDTEEEVDTNLRPVPDFGQQTSFELFESLLRFNVERIADTIAPRPIFIAHGENNQLHPFEDAYALYRMTRNPADLHRIQGKHNDFMRQDHPEFTRTMGALLRWLRDVVHYRKTA